MRCTGAWLLAGLLLGLLLPAQPFIQPQSTRPLVHSRAAHRLGQRPLTAVHALRECMLLGKSANHNARQISHSHVRTKRTQWVNLHWKRYWWQKGRCEVWLRVSTRAIKTIEKYGLDEAAKKFDLNLTDYALPFSEPRVIL